MVQYYSYRSIATIERRQIFKEMGIFDNRASIEADKKYPLTGQTMWNLSEPERRNRLIKNIDMERNLQKQYENKLLKKYGLTQEQLDEIYFEGIKKQLNTKELKKST